MTDQQRTELRLALVMNGGVSLAVWMGGVAHEVALLVRASRGQLRPPPGHPDRQVYDRWARLCAEHGVTVTVDVVAGSSAGGLNGALLATALARGAPLTRLRELWRSCASLEPGKLVRPESLAPIGSVLDGDYFADQVRAAFDDIADHHAPSTGKSHRPHISLFVTATALGSQLRVFRDSAGAEIVAADHRQLYRFRSRTVRSYDAGRVTADARWQSAFVSHEESDFSGEGSSTRLALAARASAGFPLAFEPVPSTAPGADLEPVRVRGGGRRFLMDGGVLNNAPFGPVLEEIARRPVDGPWKRVLTYVVPSGKTIASHPSRPERPDWIDTVLAAARMPSEADLRSGLEELTTLQRAEDECVQTADQVFGTLIAGTGDAERLLSAATGLLPRYRCSQVRASIVDTLMLWSPEGEAPRLDQDLLAAMTPHDQMRWVPAATEIEWCAEDWRWGTAAAERCVRMLLRAAAGGRHEDAVLAINEAVRRAEAVRDAVEAQIRKLAPAEPAAAPYELVLDIIDTAVDAARVPQVCGRLVEEAAAAYARTLPSPGPGTDAIVRRCLTAEVLLQALSGRPFRRSAGFDFLRLGPEAESPVVGPILESDDLTPIALGPWKLWGTQLGHFAAFGRAEWRMHDWRWGRLDAAAHLAGAVGRAGHAGVRDGAALRELHAGILLAEATEQDPDAGREGARLNAETRVLASMTTRGVLERFRQDDGGRATAAALVNAVLQTLRHRGRHAAATAFGDWLSTALAEQVQPDLNDEAKETVVRFFGHHLRRRLWHLVRDAGTDRPVVTVASVDTRSGYLG